MISETVRAKGHANVTSRHKTTIEITKEQHLTPKGDCIVAVSADRSMPDLSEKFKSALRHEDAILEIVLDCAGVRETITARGHPDLILTHPTDMVIRKSDFICPRTLAIRADKASCDLDRRLVEKLKTGVEISITLKVLLNPA